MEDGEASALLVLPDSMTEALLADEPVTLELVRSPELLGALCGTTEQASSLGWILSMVLAALGGCWFPSEVMPEWLRTTAHVLPTAWAMDGFHGLISYGRGVEGVWLPAVVLLGFGVVASTLAARFLRAER